jgi:hypothetical protein
MKYCQAKFIRTSGLGNRLFPWARCTIFANQNQIPMLSPVWSHIRTAPFRKGGINYSHAFRKILLFDVFKRDLSTIAGLEKIIAKITHKLVYENTTEINKANTIITFRGDAGHFSDLKGYNDFILEKIKRITKKKWLDIYESYNEIPIGINIRRGKDFVDAPLEDFGKRGLLRTPLFWYVATVKKIREIVGYNLKCYVVTDGTINDIKPLLDLGDIEMVVSPSPISDLLVLTKSKLLIASYGSSFSAWASFLGKMPTISIQDLKWFNLQVANEEQFIEAFDSNNPKEEFVTLLRKTFNENIDLYSPIQ